MGGTLIHTLSKFNTLYTLIPESRKDKGLPVKKYFSLDEFVERVKEFELIILSVPDNQIEKVAGQLSNLVGKDKKGIILHTSGTISYKILNPLKERGFIIGSLHPYFSFYKIRKDVNIDDIEFTLSCDADKKDYILRRLRRAGIRAVYIDDDKKIPYHISAVFVSNFTALLLRIAFELLEKSGFDEKDASRFIFSLINSTLTNLDRSGIKHTITGPAVRRDKRIIGMHKDFLKKYNRIYYRIYSNLSSTIQRLY